MTLSCIAQYYTNPQLHAVATCQYYFYTSQGVFLYKKNNFLNAL